MYRDGISLVGEAARASIPGDLLGPTLTIEDAWVLADSLAYGPRDIDAALTSYDTRRSRRISELLEHDSADDRLEMDIAPPLRQLAGFRRLAFNHVLDPQLLDVVRAVPDCL
jgi:2-polyprenyl-6-methoxyphenol hydroxylase-like FAD-dependent oxidoreductase